MKIQHQLSIATLLMAGVFVTGCSQQTAGGSQSAGSSQVSGGSQSQIEGGSQVAGGSQQGSSQQQVEDKVVAPVATPRPVPTPRPAYTAPAPRAAGNCHTHPANSRTKSVRHCHPNPTGQHRYAGGRKAVRHTGGNRWTHNHSNAPACAKTKRHTHKYTNRNHHHKYSCQNSYSRPAHRPAQHRAAAPRAQQPKVDVYALQRKLKAKGYYKGPIDGVVGPGTRGALKKFMNR